MIKITERPVVNTGRQVEMDVLKGSFIFLIFIIHSFQLLGNAEALSSVAYEGIFSVGMFTGASLFLFFMGFGLAYSRKQDSLSIARSGVKWIGYQFLSNICNMVVLLIPLVVYAITGTMTDTMLPTIIGLSPYILIMLNIFFIAGAIQLIMAFFKKINLPLYGYIIVAFIVAFSSPYLSQLESSNVILNFLIQMTFSVGGTVSFAFWPYISFTCIGYFFGRYFQTCKDKRQFYKKTFYITLPISIAYIAWVLTTNPGLHNTFEFLQTQYMYPNVIKCVATTAILLATAGIAYFILDSIKKTEKSEKYIFNSIHFFSKHISKLYAVHIGVYFFIFALLGYNTSSTIVCLIISIPASIITLLIVYGFVNYSSRS